MKKLTTLLLMLFMAAININAQPPSRQGMHPGIRHEKRIPETIAQNMAMEMKLDDQLSATFIPLYKAYQEELLKIDELLPMPRFERGQRPTQEQIEEMKKIHEMREQVTTEMRKIYDQKFLEVLGEKEFLNLQSIEKAQIEKRREMMRNRFGHGRGNRGNGGFLQDGFPGGFSDENNQ